MFRLEDRQIEDFARDGFVLAQDLLDARTVAVLRERFACLFRGEFETGIRPDEVNWQDGRDDPALTRQICNGWRADRAIAGSVLRADLGEAIARLGGWPGTRIMIDNLLWKPPGAKSLNFHQDNAYLGWLDPPQLLSCWMALDDTSASGGTVEFVRGSHRWQPSSAAGEFHAPARYRDTLQAAASREGVQPQIVHVEVACGGGSFHHGWTWHGSGANHGERQRRALVIHAVRSDTQFAPARLGEGTGPIYSRYKRLGDNRLDENFFPVVWREDGYRTPGIDRFVNGD